DTLDSMRLLFELRNPTIAVVAFDDASQPTYGALDGIIRNETRAHNGILLVGAEMTTNLIEKIGALTSAAVVSGSLAHELAHLYQFRPQAFGTWWTRMLQAEDFQTRRRAELHADYLAGWCVGKEAFIELQDIDLFAKGLYGLGDMSIADPNHHGTPQQ